MFLATGVRACVIWFLVINVAVVAAARRVNVALKRPSWQSSVWCPDYWGRCHHSAKAFDGVGAQTHFDTPGCAHGFPVAELYPWIAVDLLVPIHVDAVDVTIRVDCCSAYSTSYTYLFNT